MERGKTAWAGNNGTVPKVRQDRHWIQSGCHENAVATLTPKPTRIIPLTVSETDARVLVHELQVHQIELEMQNDELLCAQAAAQAALERYQDLFDFAPVAYFLWDQNGRIVEVNLAGAALLGLNRDAVIHKRFGQFVAMEHREALADFCGRVLATNTKQTCEIEVLKDGQAVGALVEGIAVQNHQGQERLCRAAVIDVRHQKRADKLAAADRAASEFQVNMSQEIRTPMTAVAVAAPWPRIGSAKLPFFNKAPRTRGNWARMRLWRHRAEPTIGRETRVRREAGVCARRTDTPPRRTCCGRCVLYVVHHITVKRAWSEGLGGRMAERCPVPPQSDSGSTKFSGGADPATVWPARRFAPGYSTSAPQRHRTRWSNSNSVASNSARSAGK